MSKKILVTLSEAQHEALNSLMTTDLASNKSSYIGHLIGQEVKARNKRGPGRPRKDEEDVEDIFDYSDDLPKNIPYFNTMIGEREYKEREEIRKQFQPQS